MSSHHPNVARALDNLREIAALLPERNRLQHLANRSKLAHRYSMAELTEASAEQCLDAALALAEQTIDLLTHARADAGLYAVADDWSA
jgi:hypothetical protein